MEKEIQLVQSLELELLNPTTRKSAKRLGELLADDFIEFTQSGSITNKEEVVNRLPMHSEESFEIHNMKSKVLANNCVLLHYIVNRTLLDIGEKKTTLCSSIWKKGTKSWQMIFFQGTPSVLQNL